MFPDEFHVDLTSRGASFIVGEQEPGKRIATENI
jgi:hypothetical protein